MKKIIIFLLLLLPTMISRADEPMIEVRTTLGDFTLRLYDDTPLHQANFLKLVKEGFYDGVTFHRVINDFMIQAGDPESKKETPARPLGMSSQGELIPAEIVYPTHFHKYGALAAARSNNPEKKSSGSQFYIVTGQKWPREAVEERYMNKAVDARMREYIDANRDSLIVLERDLGREALEQRLDSVAEEVMKEILPIPGAVLETYSTLGGTPHLDGDYTVFGEVVSGMETVEKIQKVETDPSDNPVEPVRIISMKLIK